MPIGFPAQYFCSDTHFLMKRLKNVRTEMALSVLAYNPGSGPGQALTRVMNIIGIRPLMAVIRA